MKTAAKVLGIVGGAIGLFSAYFEFQKVMVLSDTGKPAVLSLEAVNLLGITPDNSFQTGQSLYAVLALAAGVLCAIGSILGIAGGLMVNRRRFVSGAMMTAGGILNALSYLNIAVIIPLLLGGIFAVLPENDSSGYLQQPLPPKYSRLFRNPIKAIAAVLGIAGGSIKLLAAAQSFSIFAIEDHYFYGAPSYIGYMALLAAAAGVIGIAGGVLAARRRILSGLLMFTGALASVFGDTSMFSFTLLLLGGIFALVPEKKPESPKEETT